MHKLISIDQIRQAAEKGVILGASATSSSSALEDLKADIKDRLTTLKRKRAIVESRHKTEAAIESIFISAEITALEAGEPMARVLKLINGDDYDVEVGKWDQGISVGQLKGAGKEVHDYCIASGLQTSVERHLRNYYVVVRW